MLHWDEKLLPGLINDKKVDRLAVEITDIGSTQSLGTPALTSTTGESQASAIFKLLNE